MALYLSLTTSVIAILAATLYAANDLAAERDKWRERYCMRDNHATGECW